MRVNIYDLRKNADCRVQLIKEKGINYNVENKLDNPLKIVRMMCDVFSVYEKYEEHLWLIAFNATLRPIGIFEVSRGTIDATMVINRDIFTRLCLCGAAGFVLIHNHPSLDCSPSKQDIETTKTVKQAADLMGYTFFDHLIIGDAENYYSFAENKQI